MTILVVLSFSWFFLFLSVPVESSCSCTPSPPTSICPSTCTSCISVPDQTPPLACHCEPGCLKDCAAGYTKTEIGSCWLGFPKYRCSRSVRFPALVCTQCVRGKYGNGCLFSCPNCRNGGSCSEGVNGSGTCICLPGSSGPTCQYTDVGTCSGHGYADYFGRCSCHPGYSGTHCDTYCSRSQTCNNHGSCTSSGACQCDVGFAGRFCEYSNAITCSGRGIAQQNGACTCQVGFTGSHCETCANNYYPVNGTCVLCVGGSVTPSGQCVCPVGTSGENCSQCAPGRYGYPTCSECPGGASTPCNGHGVCNQASGICSCEINYSGVACNDPNILELTPQAGPTKGGDVVTIRGTSFGSSGQLLIGGSFCSIIVWNDTMIKCSTPAGYYSRQCSSVVITRFMPTFSTNHNQSICYEYGEPILLSVEPQVIGTEGGIHHMLTLNGNNFGISNPPSSSIPHIYQITWNVITGQPIEKPILLANISSSHNIMYVIPLSGVGIHSIVIEIDTFRTSIIQFRYDAPMLISLEGCTNGVDKTNIFNCSTTEMPVITLIGTNFGSNGAKVLIGGVPCQNTQHDVITPHTRLLCQIPQGVGKEKSVVLVQDGGEISTTSLSLSYAPCPSGTYTDINMGICQNCSSGTYSDDGTTLMCTVCPAGSYSGSEGQSWCELCPSGSYQPTSGQVQCLLCEPGTYSSDGAQTCTPCPPGSYSPLSGQSSCQLCKTGSYANQTGQVECVICGDGYCTDLEIGASICTICPTTTPTTTPPTATLPPTPLPTSSPTSPPLPLLTATPYPHIFPTGMILPTLSCRYPILGRMIDRFNLWLTGSWVCSNNQAHGPVAIAGSVTLSTYNLSTIYTTNSSQINLLVGGSLKWSQSALFGNGIFDGNHNITLTRVFGSGTIQRVESTNLLYNNTISTFITNQSTTVLPPIISAIENNIITTNIASLSECIMDGSNNTIFNISAPAGGSSVCRLVVTTSFLMNINQTYIHLSGSLRSTIIIVISGESLTLKNKAMQVKGGIRANSIIWVSSSLKTISFHTVTFQGTILAPYADLVMPRGSISGQLIANNFQGGFIRLNYALFCPSQQILF